MKRWIVAPAHPTAETLARDARLPLHIAQLLCTRGYLDLDAVRCFLSPRLEHLHDPFLLTGMDRGVERIESALECGERIEIHGDYDVDGAGATVILKTALELCGGTVGYRIPKRLTDGYGMQIAALEQAAEQGAKVIISVDMGIRAQAVVRRARELGVDVIVTDHHLPDSELPPALAVINPNLGGCGYPDKNLCGAGVAFKLASAILSRRGWEPAKLERVLTSFLKIVAIATVADVVPLTNENRVLVSHGLAGLADVRSAGLKALLDVAGFRAGEVPSATSVAFRIAPRINAAGRMASADDAVELLLTRDPARARELAERLHGLNSSRQSEETEILDEIVSSFEADPQSASAPALVVAGEGWHRGVLGIVASRLVERYHRPSFVLSVENGEAQGSGRSIRAYHLLDALESVRDLFIKFGGHSHAAGVTLSGTRVAEFRERLRAHAEKRLTPADLCPELQIDGELCLRDIGEDLLREIRPLEPFGSGNPEPVWAIRNVEVASEPQISNEKHLRVFLTDGKRALCFTAFQFASRASELRRGSRIDAAFTIQHDPFRGSWAVFLKDIRPASLQDRPVESWRSGLAT